jgi:dihydrofolate synthase/folylpolyglutamate synthase
VLDVAHNPHSVAALAENLDAMGYHPVTHAVFGAMADKDLGAMLTRIAPLIDQWHLTDLPLPRASTAQALAAQIESLPKPLSGPQGRVAGLHATPMDALRAAVAAADPADRIVVFGSFYTVGGVLQDGVPRLSAKHLAS